MKIALIGYGKMGHAVEKIALERGHSIVCHIDQGEEALMDTPEFRSADVAIEFTTPATAVDNYRRYLFFINNFLKGGKKMTLIYMAGEATPEQIKKLISGRK